MMILQCRVALGAVSALLMSSAALAQMPARPGTIESNSATMGTRSPAAELGSQVFRASQLKGVKVRNTAGEEVGTIHDLVIDSHSGTAAYVALSVGGFLGMGDKLFAIPYDAFTFVPAEQAPTRGGTAATDGQRTKNDQAMTATGKLNDVVAVLDISKETLQKAQGFDQNKWPNMVDASWRTTNDRAYQSLHRRQLNRAGELAATNVARASELIGCNVANANNETVGEINDLMIDDSDGHASQRTVNWLG